MSTQPRSFLTPEQYLEIERKAECKSEYYQGEMFAMAGASLPHNQLVSGLIIALGSQLHPPGCQVLPSDMRVQVKATGLYTYPDVIVLCSPPVLADAHSDVLLNPDLIVEVLSPSTEAYDRGRKFGHYRALESLKGYLLVASDRCEVELYTRAADGNWVLTTASGMEAVIELPFLGCRLALANVYEYVSVPGIARGNPASRNEG